MILLAMQSDYHEPINVGSDYEISINDLVQRSKDVFVKCTKYKPTLQPIYVNIDKDDPKVRKPCLLLNKQVLNYSKLVPLNEGLLKTLQYFKSIIDNPSETH
jgi:UDP-glucuronate decarboxylase